MSTPVESGSEAAHVFAADSEPEISVVMPCLNEPETPVAWIRKAQGALREQGIRGEIVVAGNGSSDGSQVICSHLNGRTLHFQLRQDRICRPLTVPGPGTPLTALRC